MHNYEAFPIEPMIAKPIYSNPQFSPDGKYIAMLRGTDAGKSLYLYDKESGLHRQLTTPQKISTGTAYGGEVYCWNESSDAIVFSRKGSLYSIRITGGPAEELVSLDKSFHPQIFDGHLYFLIEHQKRMSLAISEITADGYSWPSQTDLNYHFIYDPAPHPDGSIIAHVWNYPYMSWDQSSLVRLSETEEKVIAGGSYWVCQPRYSPNYDKLSYMSEKSGWINLWLMDADGTNPRQLVDETHEHSYSTWTSGSRNQVWIDNDHIVFTRNTDGRFSLVLTDMQGNLTELDLPMGYYEALHSDHKGNLTFVFSNAKHRAQIWLISLDDQGTITSKQIIAQSGVIIDRYTENFVTPTHVNFPTGDNNEAHGLLYEPEGEGPFPLVIDVHGGPTGMMYEKFRRDPQFYVQLGFAYFGINYRGSIGYGRQFRQSLVGKWGTLDVEDCINAKAYLVDKNIAKPNQTVITGGSAGGYTTLLALSLHPGMFTAGIDLYGVSDLFKLAEDTHYLEAHYLDQIVGPLPETADRYYDRSPINLAENIIDPLLILQGEEDPVVPENQSKMIADAVQGPVELKTYSGEGHGFTKTSTLRDQYNRIEKFLRKYVLNKA